MLICHPNTVPSSANPPSAASLRREAVSGLGIGSSSPALGRKIVCMAMTIA